MYTRRSVTIIICHCAKFQFFFLKLRPAADSALSVLDSHPQFEFEKFLNLHFRRLFFLIKSVRHCFFCPSIFSAVE